MSRAPDGRLLHLEAVFLAFERAGGSCSLRAVQAATGASLDAIQACCRRLTEEGRLMQRPDRSYQIPGTTREERLAALLAEARGPVQALAMDGSVVCAALLERIDDELRRAPAARKSAAPLAQIRKALEATR